jgi:DNA-binding response OmpR family regulator
LKTILVIDDETEIRELLRIFLTRAGFQVIQAEDGAAGVQVLKNLSDENPIHLVITDLLMPEQEGIETILQLKEQHPEIPILAMSGGGRMSGTLDLLATAKLLGAHKTFTKPFNPSEVVATIRTLLA